MASEENANPEKRYEGQTRNAAWGPTVAILIIACIVFLVVNGPRSSASERETWTREPNFSSSAILGGIEREVSSVAFHSAEASAFMGGVKLDFRDATMEGNEARIEVSAIMGGIDIRVPRTWTVINRVTPVMGAVEDHTHSTDDNKRLVIDGTVLMGGLKIYN